MVIPFIFPIDVFPQNTSFGNAVFSDFPHHLLQRLVFCKDSIPALPSLFVVCFHGMSVNQLQHASMPQTAVLELAAAGEVSETQKGYGLPVVTKPVEHTVLTRS